MTLEITKETRSKAYHFMKGLLKDGADGNQINELVNEMGEKIDKDLAGEILLDLLRNPDDVHVEDTHASYWFGPIEIGYFKWIINDWAEYCKDMDLLGTFRFGELKDWKTWNKQGGFGFTDKELEEKEQKAIIQICVFEWKADSLLTRSTKEFLNELYEKIDQHEKKNKK